MPFPENEIHDEATGPGCQRTAIERNARIQAGLARVDSVTGHDVRQEPAKADKEGEIRREILKEDEIEIAREQEGAPLRRFSAIRL